LVECLRHLEPFLDRTGLYASPALRDVVNRAAELLAAAALAPAVAESRDLTALVDVLLTRGMIAEKLARFPEVHESIQTLLRLAPHVTDVGQKMRIVQLVAQLDSDQGRFQSAGSELRSAIDLLETLPDEQKWQFTQVVRRMGEIEMSIGHFDAARELFRRGLQLVRPDDPEPTSSLRLSLGSAAFALQDYPAADRELVDAERLAREAGHKRTLVGVLHMRAATNNKLAARHSQADPQGRTQYLKTAQTCLQDGLRLARAIGSRWYLTALNNECGELRRLQHRFGAGRAALVRAAQVAQANGLPDRHGFALYTRAKLERDDRKAHDAFDAAVQSFRLFKRMGHFMAPSVFRMLSDLARSLGREAMVENLLHEDGDGGPAAGGFAHGDTDAEPYSGVVRPPFPFTTP
jgi:tetratricopeptide (TPR) repeat protein